MLQRILDALDEAANGLIRVFYLLSGVTAVAVYFGAGVVPAFIEGPSNAILPWALAFSVETQAYISSRRLAKAYATLQAPALEDYQKVQAKREIKTQLAIMLALLAFSVWNQFNYLGQVWHPASVTGLPIWVDYLIRAVAVPIFFLAGSFLAGQPKTIGEQMDAEAHKTLRQFLRMMSRQRKQAIRRLSGRQGPVINVLRALFPNRFPQPRMVDMSEAIAVVAEAAHEKKAGQLISSIQGALVRLSEGATVRQAETMVMTEVRAGTVHETPKQRAARHWKQGMSPKTLAGLAGVSDRQARRYIADFRKKLQPDSNVRLIKQA